MWEANYDILLHEKLDSCYCEGAFSLVVEYKSSSQTVERA